MPALLAREVGGGGWRWAVVVLLDFFEGPDAAAAGTGLGVVFAAARVGAALRPSVVGGGMGDWPGWGGGGCLRRCGALVDGVVPVGLAPVARTGLASVSVSLPVGSGDVWRVLSLVFGVSFLLSPASSAALAACTSRANQLILYHRPPQRTERIAKWMEEVVTRRTRSRSWRVPKVALVAMSRVGVGPGVKIDSQRSTMKDDIVYDW